MSEGLHAFDSHESRMMSSLAHASRHQAYLTHAALTHASLFQASVTHSCLIHASHADASLTHALLSRASMSTRATPPRPIFDTLCVRCGV